MRDTMKGNENTSTFSDLIEELKSDLSKTSWNLTTNFVLSLGSFTDKIFLENNQVILSSLKNAIEFFLESSENIMNKNLLIRISLISIEREGFKIAVSISNECSLIAQNKCDSFFSILSFLTDYHGVLSPCQQFNLILIENNNTMIGGRSFISKRSIENKFAINYVFEFPKQEIAEKKKEAVTHNRGKILVVDDAIFNQKCLYAILSSMGYNVVILDNGKAALELSLIEKFDLILMDIDMPIMNGLEATLKIRSKLNFNHNTPIILQSCSDDEASIAKYRNLFDDRISKPYKKDEIKTVLEKFLVPIINRQNDTSFKYILHKP